MLLWTARLWGPILGIVVFVIILVVTVFMVRDNFAKGMGALAYYPLAGFAIFLSYQGAIILERRAMQSDYSARTVAQPLGKIAVLGLHDRSGKVVCVDLCAKALVDGLATEVASLSYGSKIDMENPIDDHMASTPWIVRRHRLGRGDECRPVAPERQKRWTGPQVEWPQERGIFDVCIVSRVGDSDLTNVLIVDDEGRLGRFFGPTGHTAVAYRVVDGRRVEIARWEAGYYRFNKKTVGQRFQLWDFLKALTSEGTVDRPSIASRRTLAEAIDELHQNLSTMPNFNGVATFYYLWRIHGAEVKRNGHSVELDDDHANKLKEAGAIMCQNGGAFVPFTRAGCLYEYNSLIDRLFSADRATTLHLSDGRGRAPLH